MGVLLYAKTLKETKTEETIVFFVTFLSLVAIQLGGWGAGPLGPPLATPMSKTNNATFVTFCRCSYNYVLASFIECGPISSEPKFKKILRSGIAGQIST